MQDSLPAGGSAFTGRVLPPLGYDEKFRFLVVPLSRAYPVASWAHVRRKFFDISQAQSSPVANEALDRIAALYAIESEIRGLPAGQRCTARQERSRPLLDAMKEWMQPSSAFRKNLKRQKRYVTRSRAGPR